MVIFKIWQRPERSFDSQQITNLTYTQQIQPGPYIAFNVKLYIGQTYHKKTM